MSFAVNVKRTFDQGFSIQEPSYNPLNGLLEKPRLLAKVGGVVSAWMNVLESDLREHPIAKGLGSLFMAVDLGVAPIDFTRETHSFFSKVVTLDVRKNLDWALLEKLSKIATGFRDTLKAIAHFGQGEVVISPQLVEQSETAKAVIDVVAGCADTARIYNEGGILTDLPKTLRVAKNLASATSGALHLAYGKTAYKVTKLVLGSISLGSVVLTHFVDARRNYDKAFDLHQHFPKVKPFSPFDLSSVPGRVFTGEVGEEIEEADVSPSFLSRRPADRGDIEESEPVASAAAPAPKVLEPAPAAAGPTPSSGKKKGSKNK